MIRLRSAADVLDSRIEARFATRVEPTGVEGVEWAVTSDGGDELLNVMLGGLDVDHAEVMEVLTIWTARYVQAVEAGVPPTAALGGQLLVVLATALLAAGSTQEGEADGGR